MNLQQQNLILQQQHLILQQQDIILQLKPFMNSSLSITDQSISFSCHHLNQINLWINKLEITIITSLAQHYVGRGKMDNIGIGVGLGWEISQNRPTNASQKSPKCGQNTRPTKRHLSMSEILPYKMINCMVFPYLKDLI